MGDLRQLLCRHDYEVFERMEDAGGDTRLEVVELRCSKCGKSRIVAEGDTPHIGEGDLRFGSVRRP
jgi:hypothetical protein